MQQHKVFAQLRHFYLGLSISARDGREEILGEILINYQSNYLCPNLLFPVFETESNSSNSRVALQTIGMTGRAQ